MEQQQGKTRVFDYIAHITRDGHTTELSGQREGTSVQSIYQYLLQRASEMRGWLMTQQIQEAGMGEVQKSTQLVCTSQEQDPTPPPTFGASDVFGVFDNEYGGASRLIFKENDDETDTSNRV